MIAVMISTTSPAAMLVSSVTAAVLSRGTFMHGGSPTANSRTLYSPTNIPSGSILGNSARSEEHTSELQSRFDLVCRLLLEKKKIQIKSLHSEIDYDHDLVVMQDYDEQRLHTLKDARSFRAN